MLKYMDDKLSERDLNEVSGGNSAELNMIQLQSLVSQRQMVVSLATNLLSKFHDTTKSTIGNIR